MSFHDGLPRFNGPGDQEWHYRHSISSLSSYQALYRNRGGKKNAADVSPSYLSHPGAAKKIAELCPQSKIIIVLRNPVECAFSMFCHRRRDGEEPQHSFEAAFAASAERLAAGWQSHWDYKGHFLFSLQVERYLELFPKDQLFIRRYESLKHDPENFYNELCAFLGVQPIDCKSANQQVNTAPKREEIWRQRGGSRFLLKWVNSVAKRLPAKPQQKLRELVLLKPAYRLSPKDRQYLVDHFAGDIKELGKTLQWDLSDWLKV